MMAAAVGSCTEPVTVPLVTWPIAVALKILSAEKNTQRTARFRPAKSRRIAHLSVLARGLKESLLRSHRSVSPNLQIHPAFPFFDPPGRTQYTSNCLWAIPANL